MMAVILAVSGEMRPFPILGTNGGGEVAWSTVARKTWRR